MKKVVKKYQKGGTKLTSTVKGTSAINTKSKPESKAKSNFNYNTELAKKQKADALKAAAAKNDAAKKAADKKAAAKVGSGKKVKAVIESLIRPKTVTATKTVVKTPVKTPVKTSTAKTVSEMWKEKTGTSWSEAKKKGLIDGSTKSNLALLAKLKSGAYDKENQTPARMETVKASDIKVSSTSSGKLAGVGDDKGFEETIDNELVTKPGYGAKKQKGGMVKMMMGGIKKMFKNSKIKK
jgi:hypothetical protein